MVSPVRKKTLPFFPLLPSIRLHPASFIRAPEIVKAAQFVLHLLLDCILVTGSFWGAYYLRFDGAVPELYRQGLAGQLTAVLAIKLTGFLVSGLYRNIWKYAGIREVLQIGLTMVGVNTALGGYFLLRRVALPRSICILATLFDTLLVGGVRFSQRMSVFLSDIASPGKITRTMIVGAGDAGAMVIKELLHHRQLSRRPVVIVDDDRSKFGLRLGGTPVLGQREDIGRLAAALRVDEIVIAIPSAPPEKLRPIIAACQATKCRLSIVPGIYELINGKVTLGDLREIRLEDLLGREEVRLNAEQISGYLNGRRVMVTGGGGSIGAELCRRVAGFQPAELIILDICENTVFELENELRQRRPGLKLKTVIASVADAAGIEETVGSLRPDVIFHAAAHKHVPLMEANPKEAIRNNVFGTYYTARAADRHGAAKFVLVSTDKAVNPRSIMGVSKSIGEAIVGSFNRNSRTKFAIVRFGNVLGSSGSVVPVFQKQIAGGGPVTVTHPEAARYFMTIAEAAQLIVQAGAMAVGGEIFVLDMGESVRIIDLAETLIRLSSLEPYRDIPVMFSGLRPGEKITEELFLAEEKVGATGHEKIRKIEPVFPDWQSLLKQLETLRGLLAVSGDAALLDYLGCLAPTYAAGGRV